MLYLKKFESGPFQTNSYLVGSDNSNEAVLIDAAPECYSFVKEELEVSGRSIKALLITHPHLDHTFDAVKFANDGIPVMALEDAVRGIAEPEDLGLMHSVLDSTPGTKVNRIISGGEILNLSGLSFQVLEVPGHCVGSAAFYLKEHSMCFAGDVIFYGSVGRTDLLGGDFNLLSQSIKEQIYSLPDTTILWPGHGAPTDVLSEKKNNPYVKG